MDEPNPISGPGNTEDVIKSDVAFRDAFLWKAHWERTFEDFAETQIAMREIVTMSVEHLPDMDDPMQVAKQSIDLKSLVVYGEGAAEVRDEMAALAVKYRDIRSRWIGAGRPRLPKSTPGEVIDLDDNPASEMEKARRDLGVAAKLRGGDVADQSRYLRLVLLASEALGSPKRFDMLFGSLLTTAVGGFEVLLSSHVRHYFQLRPEALMTDDTPLKWSQVRDYGTVAELQQAFIDSRTDDLLRGSFSSWMKWLNARVAFDVSKWVDVDGLTEIFQRRHVIVHNGGRVSPRYVEECRFLPTTPSVGSKLPVDHEYLSSAFDKIMALSFAITIQFLSRLSPGDQDSADLLDGFVTEQQLQFLSAGRPEIVRETASEAYAAVSGEFGRHAANVNRWLALHAIEGSASVAVTKEVSAWDTRALGKIFELAKLILLSKNDEALALVDQLRASGEVTSQDWERWPLFAPIRDDRPAA